MLLLLLLCLCVSWVCVCVCLRVWLCVCVWVYLCLSCLCVFHIERKSRGCQHANSIDSWRQAGSFSLCPPLSHSYIQERHKHTHIRRADHIWHSILLCGHIYYMNCHPVDRQGSPMQDTHEWRWLLCVLVCVCVCACVLALTDIFTVECFVGNSSAWLDGSWPGLM